MADEVSHQHHSRAALERLERALRRLEGVVGKNSDLFLAEDLRQARDDYARLDEAAQAVEDRLDGVIGRLRVVLGDEE